MQCVLNLEVPFPVPDESYYGRVPIVQTLAGVRPTIIDSLIPSFVADVFLYVQSNFGVTAFVAKEEFGFVWVQVVKHVSK